MLEIYTRICVNETHDTCFSGVEVTGYVNPGARGKAGSSLTPVRFLGVSLAAGHVNLAHGEVSPLWLALLASYTLVCVVESRLCWAWRMRPTSFMPLSRLRQGIELDLGATVLQKSIA